MGMRAVVIITEVYEGMHSMVNRRSAVSQSPKFSTCIYENCQGEQGLMLNTKLLITNKFYSTYVRYIYCTNMVSHAYY